MYPTLIQLGPLSISSMGLFMTLAFLSASFLIWREAKSAYLDEETVLDVFMLALALGIVGARISFIVLHPGRFGVNILRWLLPTWMPGFYLYGGVIFGLGTVFFVSERKKIPLFKILDTIVPGVMFAAALYKVGQWLDGSLVGIKTSTFFGLPVVGEVGRFVPVALLEAAVFLVIFAFLVKTRNYFIVKRKIRGALFLAGVSLASLAESGFFFLIRDNVYFASIPVSLSLSVLAFFVSGIILYRKTRNLESDLKKLQSYIPRKLSK